MPGNRRSWAAAAARRDRAHDSQSALRVVEETAGPARAEARASAAPHALGDTIYLQLTRAVIGYGLAGETLQVVESVQTEAMVANGLAVVVSSPSGTLVPQSPTSIRWQSYTRYPAGWIVVNPSGQIVAANVDFVSGGAYIAGNWTVLNDVGSGSTAGVASFQGRTGTVSLTKADVTGTGLAAADVGADASGAATTAQNAATAASQGAWNPRALAAAATAALWDYVLADTTGGTFAVAAPTPTAGKQFAVKWKAGTVAPTLTGTFNSSPVISALDQAIEFISDGTTWYRTVRPALAQLPDYPGVTDTRYAGQVTKATVVATGLAPADIGAMAVTPVANGYSIESVGRRASFAAQPLAGTGVEIGVSIYLPAGTVVSKLGFLWATAGSTQTHLFYTLRSPTGALLATTADQTSTTPTISTVVGGQLPVALDASGSALSSYTAASAGWYFIGLVQAASTMGTVHGVSDVPAVLAPVQSYADTSHTGLTTPSSAPATAALLGVSRMLYGGVT